MKIVINPCKVKVILLPSQVNDFLKQRGLILSKDSVSDLVRLYLERLTSNQALQVISALISKGLVKYEDEEYDVEEILDHDVDEAEGSTYYLVKWEGWPLECATWECEPDLANCQEVLREYKALISGGSRKRARPPDTSTKQQQLERSKARVLELLDCIDFSGLDPDALHATLTDTLNRKALYNMFNGRKRPDQIIRRRGSSSKAGGGSSRRAQIAKAQRELQQWQLHLNTVCSDKARILVENKVDIEGPPWSFRYVNQRVAGPGVTIPTDPVFGCECTDCYAERHNCVQVHMHNEGCVPYTKHGKLRDNACGAVHECNALCKCGPDCPYRVVQKGRTVPLAIFRTKNRGWGVKTLQRIARGTFVIEYVGEVVTSEEAERRGLEYDREGQTYLFDLDLDGDPLYSVDARDTGNIAHFLNHSCSPNLGIRCVFTDCIDRHLPQLALFALESIPSGTELTFDYHMSGYVGQLQQQQQQEEEQQQQQQPPGSSSSSSSSSSGSNISQSDTNHHHHHHHHHHYDHDPHNNANDKANAENDDGNKENADNDSENGKKGPEKIRCLCGSAKCRGYLFD